MRTLQALAIVVAIVVSCGGEIHAQDQAAKDLETIQGLWHALFLRQHDFANPAIPYGMRVLIKGDTITFSPLSTKGYSGTIKLDPSATPRRMDVAMLDGPLKGKTVQCVYELRKDVFLTKLCVASFDGDRGTRERPDGLKPGAEDDYTAVDFLREGDIDPDMLAQVRPGPGEPAGLAKMLAAYATYIKGWAIESPDLSETLLNIPFVADGEILRDTPVVKGFQDRHPGDFKAIDKIPPRILDVKPYAEAGDVLTPEMKTRLDPVLEQDDLVIVVAEGLGVEPPMKKLVFLGLRGKPQSVKILGVIRR